MMIMNFEEQDVSIEKYGKDLEYITISII